MRRTFFLLATLVLGWLPLAGCSKVEGSVPLHEGDPKQTSDLGYSAAFEVKLQAIGEIAPEELVRNYAPPNYLDKLSWDPTTAKFWDRLMADPKDPALDATSAAMESHPREQIEKLLANKLKHEPYDFRLNDDEQKLYRQNGFVVSERMGSHSFTDMYYRIYVRDLPVFVTADSMLHAWHRHFDRLLEGLETQEIKPTLTSMLSLMANQLPLARDEYENDVLQDSLEDVDFFLCVARRLLSPEENAPTAFDQEDRVLAALKACDQLTTYRFSLFGQERVVDFSQFKPRGRYDESDWSRQYFRAVMWLGRIDFRLSGTKSVDQELRELGAVVVLHDLLSRSGWAGQWEELDRLLQKFVGQSDCLNFTQFGELIRAHELPPAAKMTADDLINLHNHVTTGRVGRQQIRGDYYCADPSDPNKFVLPANFAFLGQRFVLDSWALTKVVYDDISWKGEKVNRRFPSSLEMAFGVLANNHATPHLVDRIFDTTGKPFRDGLPYQHNLVAVRQVIDSQPESTWDKSIYAQWLGCLRELSVPTVSTDYPEAVRTAPWGDKATTTQLASWTQLRHDTVLYAKPAYTMGVTCYYPAGYVEPVPHFWRRFHGMIRETAEYFAKMPLALSTDEKIAWHQERTRQQRVKSLERFSTATEMLSNIVEKQMEQAEFSPEETTFLQEIVVRNNMCGAPPIGGWYPQLFDGRNRPEGRDADRWTALVTDVHTDPTAGPSGDPGSIVHEAVGNVELLVIAIDNGEDRLLYCGPVFSHYEFETSADVRLTNTEWHDQLRKGQKPPRTPWSASYSVPGINPDAAEYGLEKTWRE